MCRYDEYLKLSNFPSRCITWCNQTTNYLCICPSDSLKIQRNNRFICELSINSKNCSINDEIRQCSFGQCCFNGQCLDCSLITTLPKTINTLNFTDEHLRIIFGVIAGLLGTSLIILFSTFCWLRQRQRLIAKKSQSNTTISSLYMSPIPEQGNFLSIISRTDSFRHAVLSGNYSNQIIEHVSTKRDSFINEKNRGSSPTFSTLEYIDNIYQIIPSNIRTQTV